MNGKFNCKIYIINEKELIWEPPDDVEDIYCLLIIICKYYQYYHTGFTQQDILTFDMKYHYDNRKIYEYYMKSIKKHYDSNYRELHIQVHKKKEAYILYILSKIYNYKFIVEKTFTEKEIVKSRLFIKRYFYPKYIKLLKN